MSEYSCTKFLPNFMVQRCNPAFSATLALVTAASTPRSPSSTGAATMAAMALVSAGPARSGR